MVFLHNYIAKPTWVTIQSFNSYRWIQSQLNAETALLIKDGTMFNVRYMHKANICSSMTIYKIQPGLRWNPNFVANKRIQIEF